MSLPAAITGDRNGDDFTIYDGICYRFSWGDGRTRGAFTGWVDRSKSVQSAVWFEHEDKTSHLSIDPDLIRDIEEVV